MKAVDLNPEELFKYKPELTRRPDFDSFWKESLAESKNKPLDAELSETRRLLEVNRNINIIS